MKYWTYYCLVCLRCGVLFLWPLAVSALASSSEWQAELRRVMLAWENTPYLYGGEGDDSIDCSALVRRVYACALGLDLPRRAAWQAQEGWDVPYGHWKAGDLLFFGDSTGKIVHVGIWVGEGRFFNATVTKGAVESEISHPFWWSRYRMSKRLPIPKQRALPKGCKMLGTQP